jgi:hypothetical protein
MGLYHLSPLNRETGALQDDSGVPFRYFQTGPWKVQVYGDYRRPSGPSAGLNTARRA